MVRALIIGGSGLLGRALQRRARPADRLQLMHHHNPVEGSQAFDIRAAFEVPAQDFDVVICALPLAKILMEAGEEKVQLARQVCAGLRHASAVLLSTDAVFNGRDGNYSEDARPDPITDYGRAQLALDETFLETCPRGLVVRTSFLFGGRAPHFDKRLGPLLTAKVSSAEQRWPGNIFRSPTEADFCAEAIWRCIEKRRAGVMNICGERMSIHGFFAAALSARGNFAMPPPTVENKAEVAVDTSLDPGLMESELGIDRGTGWAWFRATSGQGDRRDAD
jgi:dTDP-4-dehydrorhamnose reductase